MLLSPHEARPPAAHARLVLPRRKKPNQPPASSHCTTNSINHGNPHLPCHPHTYNRPAPTTHPLRKHYCSINNNATKQPPSTCLNNARTQDASKEGEGPDACAQSLPTPC